MRKAGIILIFSWVLFRLIFHSFDFSNSEILSFLYFCGNNAVILGFFFILYSLQKSFRFKVFGLRKIQFERILKILIMYSCFCMITDILMLLGIGAHDFWAYTAISISLISIGMLWAIFV